MREELILAKNLRKGDVIVANMAATRNDPTDWKEITVEHILHHTESNTVFIFPERHAVLMVLSDTIMTKGKGK